MRVAIRRYSNALEVLDAIEQSRSEIEHLLRDVPGFVSYYLVRTGQSGATITICENRIGIEEANRLAATWVTEHVPSAHGNTPDVFEGEAVFQISR
jgi:hypothetical protein